ncbi:MAG: MrpF/PhaF family protein [Desulfurivibrio sp.]|nr:MrpF/PhaF family protein [Desulfurivibrio sp.]
MTVDTLLLGCVLFLLLTVCLGLVRVARGPGRADRMLSAQLFGTSGVAIFLLLAELHDDAALRHIGLVYALLAAVAVVTFVRRATAGGSHPTEAEPVAASNNGPEHGDY